MKLKVLLLTLLTCLAACSKTERVIERVGPGGSPQTGETAGPTDSGGGNGANGKALESFKIKIHEDPRFLRLLEPILDLIQEKNPDMFGSVLHVLSERNWYMVPVPMKAIPSERIGVSFIKTEQIALQSHSEVWFDSTIFDKMSDSEKTVILVHELMMGIRLFQFQDKLDMCLRDAELHRATPANGAAEEKRMLADRNTARKECFFKYRSVPFDRKRLRLDEKTDYPLIRKTTSLLIDAIRGGITHEELDYYYNKLLGN